MLPAIMIRISSIAMHSMMGGMAVFCLYYAAQATDHDFVRYLLLEALKWGGLAGVILYYQGKYLDG
jgi:hypothetical protein